jgi:hypothetical protein
MLILEEFGYGQAKEARVMEKVQRIFLALVLAGLLPVFFSCGSSGNSCTDHDGDGYGHGCSLGSDCNDNNRYIHPGAPEVCDGLDNNCNGLIDEQETISFADSNLQKAMIRALSLTTGSVSNTDLCHAATLNLMSAHISNLGGIEYAAQTQTLALDNNDITDISLLSRLRNLQVLTVGNNNISNISPLSSLTGLGLLDIYSNKISDLSPLASLTGLTALNIGYNPNLINISVVAKFTRLQILYLDHSSVASLQPVFDNPGIGGGAQLKVYFNPLDQMSCCSYIPSLRSRGAVFLDDDGYCAAQYSCP